MAKVKYNAGNSDADVVEAFGYEFEDGKSVEVKDEDLAKFKVGNPFFEVQGGTQAAPKPVAPKPAATTPPTQENEPQGPFTVKEGDGGWHSILDKDGKQVGNKIRKDDADEFAAMSAEDQAEYLK